MLSSGAHHLPADLEARGILSRQFVVRRDFVALGSGTQSHQVRVIPGRPVASSLESHHDSPLLTLCATDVSRPSWFQRSQVADRICTGDLVVVVLNGQFRASPKPDCCAAMVVGGKPEIAHFHVHLFDFAALGPEGRVLRGLCL
jgi:hypothetical protein